ncbi:hypothetical protein [Pantoea sp. CTOTU46764]|uniref:hypothetical protein n=1 Tax=Pantoea sp. CTOTU46764 TaxID=2953854 RepID=UPI0028A0AE4F|nr:hypothetical protein [Pantoea sp. CTOTU46764]
MKTFYVDWLTPCRKCGKKDAEVKTIHGSRTRLWEDDGVKCRNCGLTGIVQALEGHAWCLWDEVENDGREG